MSESATKIRDLIARLNRHGHEYYNLNAPTISDAEYDRMIGELEELEKATRIVFTNSPTQKVGYDPISNLNKTQHEIPLLSLDKTKSVEALLEFADGRVILLMHKLDGLTIKLVYEEGILQSASTRGNGETGELVTHNISAISDVPNKIPYKDRLVVTGEGHILDADFEELKNTFVDSSDNSYKNSRNLAAGSIRLFDPAVCVKRRIRFTPFSVLEGLDEEPVIANSKFHKLLRLQQFGFTKCFAFKVDNPSIGVFKASIEELQKMAAKNGIPIDGIVATFNDIEYSRSLGRTNKYYKDGMAFKFRDDTYETILRSVTWNTSRFGILSPVANFDTVVIDGCEVSNATLHNLTFINDHQINVGDRLMVSKRGAIIPHIEENLDMDGVTMSLPATCPKCGQPTVVKDINLICRNQYCSGIGVRKFVHFTAEKAMNIAGLSEATLEKLFERGWLVTFADLYKLSNHKDDIVAMKSFGIKSYNKMIEAIEKSRNTTFERFLIAMDIPLVGSHVSKKLKAEFNNDLCAFREAVIGGRNFSLIENIGETIDNNIHIWFSDEENRKLWDELYPLMTFENAALPSKENSDNIFSGCKVVVTGTIDGYTRTTIKTKLESLGATVSSSVSSKTDYVIVGDAPGQNKIDAAEKNNVKIISGDAFLARIAE